ncbi:cytochrome P450 4C1 [Caerostris extrusa]|uniref:Cytochrome P450 4C1 n=1 Tax=Caerostris extrusa TaxID=172846 RepID=A0AAV4XAW1_CAEEX|nr:cytochrome P450 4C1 [Caerostris extrusa]
MFYDKDWPIILTAIVICSIVPILYRFIKTIKCHVRSHAFSSQLQPYIFNGITSQVLLSSTTIIDKSKEYGLLSSWFGTGFADESRRKVEAQSKVADPCFSFSILENFIPVFNDQASILVSKLHQSVHEPWIDVVPLMASCTLDVICQTAMGVSINAQSGENRDYVKAVHDIGNTFMYRGFRPWLYPEVIFYRTAIGKNFKANLQCIQGLTRNVMKQKEGGDGIKR